MALSWSCKTRLTVGNREMRAHCCVKVCFVEPSVPPNLLSTQTLSEFCKNKPSFMPQKTKVIKLTAVAAINRMSPTFFLISKHPVALICSRAIAHKTLTCPQRPDWHTVHILTQKQTGLLHTHRFTPTHRPTCPQTHPHTYMQCLRLCEIDTQLSFTGALKRIISLLAVTNEISTAVPSTAAGAEATFLFG